MTKIHPTRTTGAAVLTTLAVLAGGALIAAPVASAEPAPSTITAAFAPGTLKSSRQTAVELTVASTGSVAGGGVTVTSGPLTQRFTIADSSNPRIDVTLFKYTGGAHTITVSFAGTATAAPVDKAFVITIRKVTPVLYVSTSPRQLAHRNTHSRLYLTVYTGGNPADGARIDVSSAATPHILNFENVGHYPRPGIPQLNAGVHKWTITYSGNRYTNPVTRGYKFTVLP